MNARLAISRVTLAFALVAAASSVWGLDRVTFRRNGQETQLAGRTLVTAQDGGVLLEAPDGVLWPIPVEEIVSKSSDATPFAPLSAEELSAKLLRELPAGFDVYRTSHYVICHNTSRDYAQWCGSLFERLYQAFTNYWSRKGFELHDPELPLVAIVFANRESYARFAQPDLGDNAGSIIGYFNLQSNRMVMYDLTGVDALGKGRGKISVSRLRGHPDADRTVATIVHEATHQIAFNCGLHRRLSDCPVWFSEGIAVYFETPDASNSKGWRTIGAVNRPRLEQFRKYLRTRPSDSLKTLISEDKRFRDPQRSLDAYAETWSLTYFLIRQYPQQYVAYLKALSAKSPLVYDQPAERIAQFEAAFGDLAKLDAEFLRYLAKVQ